MKKFTVIALAALAVFALASCSKKKASGGLTLEKGVLKIGMEIGYPPFEYYALDGTTPTGFDVELGKEVAARLGLEAQFIDTAWDGILAGLDTDKYDCIMSAMTITAERKANYDFSAPYIGNGQSIVVLKENQAKLNITGPADLAGLEVGYQDETTSDIFINKYAQETGMQYKQAEYDKVLNAFNDLALGRVNAVVADSLVSVDYVADPEAPYVIVWLGDPDEYFGVCVKKGNTELQEKITGAIKDMFSDGTMVKISEKIFNADMVTTAASK